MIFAARSFGKPNIPELIAGIETLRRPSSRAKFSTARTAERSFSSSPPSPILGPTAVDGLVLAPGHSRVLEILIPQLEVAEGS